MPYLKIETNCELGKNSEQEFLKKTSGFVANLLEKPEKYIMISVDLKALMMFSGSTRPSAYIELKSIGLPADKCSDFSDKVCCFIESELNIPSDRIYIDFCDIDGKMFGWNKGTF